MADEVFRDKVLGCLLAGDIGDAMGTPSENLSYDEIKARLGWIDDFVGDGTDDTVMKRLLIEALTRTDGYATMDDWAQVWLDGWDHIFGQKVNKFFVSVLHTAQKLRFHSVPRMAALGNMPSSSSAMCISPVGIVNAGRPALAAQQAYGLAGLIHIHDVGFCQDGAAAIAAAVSASFCLGATVDSVIQAALGAILPLSGAQMVGCINAMLDLARETGEYDLFCRALYADRDRFFCRITCDSRETIPIALSCLWLAKGDVERTIIYCANLGRDADTTATMAGAIAGALCGVSGIPERWRDRLGCGAWRTNEAYAEQLVTVARRKAERDTSDLDAFRSIQGT